MFTIIFFPPFLKFRSRQDISNCHEKDTQIAVKPKPGKIQVCNGFTGKKESKDMRIFHARRQEDEETYKTNTITARK